MPVTVDERLGLVRPSSDSRAVSRYATPSSEPSSRLTKYYITATATDPSLRYRTLEGGLGPNGLPVPTQPPSERGLPPPTGLRLARRSRGPARGLGPAPSTEFPCDPARGPSIVGHIQRPTPTRHTANKPRRQAASDRHSAKLGLPVRDPARCCRQRVCTGSQRDSAAPVRGTRRVRYSVNVC